MKHAILNAHAASSHALLSAMEAGKLVATTRGFGRVMSIDRDDRVASGMTVEVELVSAWRGPSGKGGRYWTLVLNKPGHAPGSNVWQHEDVEPSPEPKPAPVVEERMNPRRFVVFANTAGGMYFFVAAEVTTPWWSERRDAATLFTREDASSVVGKYCNGDGKLAARNVLGNDIRPTMFGVMEGVPK